MQTVTRAARRAAHLYRCKSFSLAPAKRAAHRAARRSVSVACHKARFSGEFEHEVRRVLDSWDVA